MKLLALTVILSVTALLQCAVALNLGRAVEAGPDFEHLRSSVVRIQAVSATFDWLTPFSRGGDGVGLGSGFVVQVKPYPLFVTNAHVINDASQVTLQLLLFGQQQWVADVVSVCTKYDVALLVLRDPDKFSKAMSDQNITLEALKLSSDVTFMGQDVVALGFPLGQDALKISKGNIAGNEEVNENICIQSTAPISPGSSGGPLLDSEGKNVVGINFAKASTGENINYVIPVWRVRQLMRKHLKDQPDMPTEGLWKRVRVLVPKAEVTTIEANEALYELSGGCRYGVYIARIGDRSLFHNARPPISDRSFLVSVNGHELDKFGKGHDPSYTADKVSFMDLFFMVDDLSTNVEFETCSDGKVSKHSVPLSWKSEYERGIHHVDEPNLMGMGRAYEMFGDISVMEMTTNHISAVLSTLGDPGPARWLHPDLVATPRLIVNYVRPGSYAADVMPVGSAVSRVNGHRVHTLEEFREHLVPQTGDVWTIETDMGKLAAVKFNKSLSEQVSQAISQSSPHLLTVGVVSAARQLGIMAQEEGGSASVPETGTTGSVQAGRTLITTMGKDGETLHHRVSSFMARPGSFTSVFAASPPTGDALATQLPLKAAGPLLAELASGGRVGSITTAGTTPQLLT